MEASQQKIQYKQRFSAEKRRQKSPLGDLFAKCFAFITCVATKKCVSSPTAARAHSGRLVCCLFEALRAYIRPALSHARRLLLIDF